jgi:putative ABC transport system permease protein
MDKLVLANIAERPARAAATVFGIAIGIVLIVVTSGLARGMLNSSSQRESNVGAELLFQPPGSFGAGVTTAPLSLPVAYAVALGELDGVDATTPVGRYIRSGGGGLGFELVEGIEFQPMAGHQSYQEITGLQVMEGREPDGSDEVIIDRQRAADNGSEIGSTMELFGRSYTVVGIYEPEIGARIKMPLASMQDLLGADSKCSWILIKTSSPHIQEAVAARVEGQFPGNQIIFTRDIPSFYEKGIPSLTVFLKVVVGLAIVISSLVVLLAMYTAVASRTREIGILKSLGASRRFIVSIIEEEALTISAAGVAVGILMASAVGAGITQWTALVVELELGWLIVASAVVMLSGGLGAIYPAFQAAKQDAVEALSYE